MKLIVLSILLLSILQSDEMQRIEAIVKDIEKLRANYEECKESLNSNKSRYEVGKYKKLLKQEREKNSILRKKIRKLESLSTKKVVTKAKKREEIEFFKACSFILNSDCDVYNAPNGKKVDRWEKTTSFTSNQKTQNWIRITGYFKNKKWLRARKKMWVRYDGVNKK